MQLPDSYYEDEVRDGFYIPSMGKKAWAAALAVLNEVDRICTKHNIQYFAEWGTLLGAIRHGGFIPWDDDLDIAMKRADYEKFLQVAPKEFPEGFEIFNLRNHENHWYFLARVVNTSRMRFEEEHLSKYHGFPYIVGLDIFVLDYVSRDEEAEEKRRKTIEYILAVADGLEDRQWTNKERDVVLDRIESLCHAKLIHRRDNALLKKELYINVEKFFGKFKEDEADYLVQLMSCGLYGNKLYLPKEYYEYSVRVPFENTTIPVPIAYDRMLRKRYGDYMKLVRNSGGHNYPFYGTQQKSLEELMDFEVPRYVYDPKVQGDRVTGNAGHKALLADGLKELRNIFCNLESLYQQNVEACVELLQNSQQLAIEMGELIENVKGEGHASIASLEEYCEKIFQVYTGIVENKSVESLTLAVKELSTALDGVQVAVEDVIHRKNVVFLPYKAELWDGFASLWEQYKQDDAVDVYVMAVPYYYKDFLGRFLKLQDDFEKYPDDVSVLSVDSIHLELMHPDVIYIQNPFDEWNTEISVPKNYYSMKLVQATERLVYVPAFEVYEFTKDSYREFLNMDAYVKVPGVCNADEVIVQSENMRRTYIDKLVEFAGEEYRTHWEEVVRVEELPITKANVRQRECVKKEMQQQLAPYIKKTDGSNKKILMYYIGFGSLLEYGQQAIEKFERALGVFEEHKEEVVLILQPQELIEQNLPQINLELYRRYQEVIGKFASRDWVVTGDKLDLTHVAILADAYYGDTSTLVQQFRNENKPIMIQSYEV